MYDRQVTTQGRLFRFVLPKKWIFEFMNFVDAEGVDGGPKIWVWVYADEEFK